MAFLSNHYSQKKKKSGRSIWLYLVNSSYIEHVFGLVNPGAIVHVLRLLLQLRTRPPLAVARVTWWLTGANSKGAPSQWRYAMTTTVRDVGSQQNQLNSAGNAQRMVVTWPSQVTAAMLKTPLQCNFSFFFRVHPSLLFFIEITFTIICKWLTIERLSFRSRLPHSVALAGVWNGSKQQFPKAAIIAMSD